MIHTPLHFPGNKRIKTADADTSGYIKLHISFPLLVFLLLLITAKSLNLHGFTRPIHITFAKIVGNLKLVSSLTFLNYYYNNNIAGSTLLSGLHPLRLVNLFYHKHHSLLQKQLRFSTFNLPRPSAESFLFFP